jgi:cellulose synthase/poly-beta-1,6-N-acetylglucosamine synthase-like glycosyltransferase
MDATLICQTIRVALKKDGVETSTRAVQIDLINRDTICIIQKVVEDKYRTSINN